VSAGKARGNTVIRESGRDERREGERKGEEEMREQSLSAVANGLV